MSVLIKGMEMPYGCANCSFCSSPIYDCKGMATYCCNIDVEELRGKDVTEEVLNMWECGASESFPAWCPLIEVPDGHGRLIDADELRKKYFCEGNIRFDLITVPVENILYQIDIAPTVIPSDKDGET